MAVMSGWVTSRDWLLRANRIVENVSEEAGVIDSNGGRN